MEKLDALIDEASEVLSLIDETRCTVQDHLRDIDSTASDIDSAIAQLSIEASRLTKQIDDVRTAAPHLYDPVVAATILAIDNLLTLLTDAKTHFTDGNSMAAYGTLTAFDTHADDLRAAFRLRQMQQRRGS